MKLSFPLAAACAAILSLSALSACSGGGSDAGASNTAANDPAALAKTDIAIGTGLEATSGARVQVNYTGWLYSAAASANGYKGSKFDASASGKPFTFVIGATNTSESVIPGFGQGVLGMKVGGKRTVVVPSSLGYGAQGYAGVVPGKTGLVFDVELVKVCGTAAC